MFRRGISGKAVFFILTGLLVANLVLLFTYTQHNRLVLDSAKREASIQKVLNVIHLVRATPPGDREKAIAAIEDPNFSVKLANKARWKLHFDASDAWSINYALHDTNHPLELSLRLNNGRWLNFSAKTVNQTFMMQLLLILLEVLIAAVILISAWSVSRFVGPLKNFKVAAERLGIDVNTKPIRFEYGPAIVHETARAMNKMQQRIQDLIRDRTQMIAAISHDLRTPITRMKLRARLLEESPHYEKIIADLDEMESMIAQTMAFAKEDSRQEDRVPLDLKSLLESICNDFEDMGETVTFSCEMNSLKFLGRSVALKRAFNNLIGNALKYGKEAHVKLFASRKNITITIEDKGPGIPDKELEQVFAPFYRVEQSRSKDTGGVGLGLAVTKDIISSHQGTIQLMNIKPHGLKVIINFSIHD